MLDMGWTEMLLIGVVALIVVGPKDLPRMFRTLGQYAGKVRGMAREFQRSMDDAAREADLNEFKDIKGALDDVRSVQNSASQSISKTLTSMNRDLDKAVDLEDKAPPASQDLPKPELPKVPVADVPATEPPPADKRTGTDGA